MTSKGALAILALPRLRAPQLQLLVAVETVAPDVDGWRAVSDRRLASLTGMSLYGVEVARARLTGAELAECRVAHGSRQRSRWRILVTLDGGGGGEP